MMKPLAGVWAAVIVLATASVTHADYLNNQNSTVALGPTMAPQPFANRATADSLASVIDAPSASASELHNQSTHVWVSGGVLELVFDFLTEYDLTTLHFWNYHSESHDVDNISLQFYDASNALVGAPLNITPTLGGSAPSDSTPIFAQNINLTVPGGVRYVNAVLSGSNGQVDFNNMGFSGMPTVVPEPTSGLLILAGLGTLGLRFRHRRRRDDSPAVA